MTAIVTATMDWSTARDCAMTWMQHAHEDVTLYIVGQHIKGEGFDGPPEWEEIGSLGRYSMVGYRTNQVLGVVPAFAIGVQRALEAGHDLIACLHDDVEIHEPAWDVHVQLFLETRPMVGLVGFGGGVGLGDHDIYQTPYNPMQLARRGFVSNMRDAEAHGSRALEPVPVACLDGFSQIGRREFWQGWSTKGQTQVLEKNLFQVMADWGIVHHAYDAALGCFARRLGWDVWMLPERCHHYGGRTAVANGDYQRWANEQRPAVPSANIPGGDQYFWHAAHQIVYEQFRDVLPID